MSKTEREAEFFRLLQQFEYHHDQVIEHLIGVNDDKRALLADVYTALLAAGWHDDDLLNRVKEAGKK